MEPVSAVIPAYNEESTVAGVVRAVAAHPAIREVIVVDDGSWDDTAMRAREAGAKVIILPRNAGKAGAMEAGAASSSSDIILFVDADVIGLSRETLDALIGAVSEGGYIMFAASVGRKRFARWLARFLPLLSGIRALRRSVWESVPVAHKKGFRIEAALNYFAARGGGKAGSISVPDLRHVIKEKKRGFRAGFAARLRMIADIVIVILALHGYDRLRRFFRT